MDWLELSASMRLSALLFIYLPSILIAVVGANIGKREVDKHGKQGLFSKILTWFGLLSTALVLLILFASRVIDSLGLFKEPLP